MMKCSIIRSWKKLGFFLCTVVMTASVFAEGEDPNYKQNLSAESSEVSIKAIQTAATKKDAETVDILISILKNNPDPKVLMAAADAIGKIPGKSEPVKPIEALRDSIKTDMDNSVVYVSLLSMTNQSGSIKDLQQAPAVMEALEYCRENKKDDVYISDLLVKYEKFLSKK